jgi:ribonuclease HII
MSRIAGVDEAGRGPLAGPVMVAAVIVDPANVILGLADSKVLSAKRRASLEKEIIERSLAWSVIAVSAQDIDRLNILQATLLGMQKAIDQLPLLPDEVWIDGNQAPASLTLRRRCIVDGDASVDCISAASILAKEARDRYLRDLDQHWPAYGFARHKGYPTREHLAALQQFGPCPEHRRSFAPVRRVIDRKPADEHR